MVHCFAQENRFENFTIVLLKNIWTSNTLFIPLLRKVPMHRENVGIFRDYVMLCNSVEHVSFERKLLSTEIRKKQILKISTQWQQLNAYILGD